MRRKEGQWDQEILYLQPDHPASSGADVDDLMPTGIEQYLVLAEAATDAIVVSREDGILLYANPATERLFGYSRDALTGVKINMLVPEHSLELRAGRLRRYPDEPSRGMSGLYASGEEFPLEVSCTEFVHEGRRCFVSLMRNPGRREYIERDRFFELSLDMFCVANCEGHFELVNPAFEENLGYSTEEMLSRPFLDLVHPEDQEKTAGELERLARGEPVTHFENRYVARDGGVVWLSWKAVSVADDGTIYAAARNITGQKRDEAEIQTRSRQQAAVADMGRLALAAPNLHSVLDEAVRIVGHTLGVEYCEVMELLPGGERLLVKSSFGWDGGISSGRYTTEAGGRSHSGYTLARDEAVVMEDADTEGRFLITESLRIREIKSGLSAVIRGEKDVFGVIVAYSTEKRIFTKNDVDFVQSIANVISETVYHHRYEKELKVQSETLREQAEILDLAHVLIRDMEDRIIFWNFGAENLYGFPRDEAIGRITHELLATEHPEPYARIQNKILTDGVWDGELVHTTREGRRISVASHCVLHADAHGNPVAILEVNNDVTGLREAEEELGRTDQRFRFLVQNLSDVISIVDAEGLFQYVSPSVRGVLGVESSDLVGTSGFDLLHPEDRDRAGSFLAALVEGTARHSAIELRLRRSDGSWRCIEANVVSMLDEEAVGGIVATFRDVTERKLSEDALLKSESRFRSVFEQAADAVLVHDLEGRFTDANRRAYESLGYSREEILSMRVQDIEVGIGFPSLDEIWQKVVSGGPITVEGVHLRKDGTTFPVEVRAGPFEIEGEPLVLVIARDATERKEAEREIHESHALLTSVIEGTHDSIFMKDSRGRYLMVNSQAASLLGKSAEEVVGKTDWELLDPEAAALLVEVDRLVMEGGEAQTVEETLPVGGEVKSFIVTKSAYRDHEGEVAGVIGVAIDVTELKETARALRESEALYRAVVEQTTENIFLLDSRTKRIVRTNVAFQESLGYTAEEIEGLTLYDIVAHDRESIDRNLRRILRSGHAFLGERAYLRKDGTFLEVEVGAAALSYGDMEAVCVVAHDITERKDAEEALSGVREAERRRIARDLHDLSLQHIVSALQSVQATHAEEGAGDDSDVELQASALREAIRGLRSAIYDLRLDENRPFVASIESLMEMSRRLSPGLKTTLDISKGFPRDLPEGLKTQLTRVIQEALANIRRHSGARSVRVSASCENEWIEVTVSDDGRGFVVLAPSLTPATQSGYGVGLSGMAERMRVVGGELSVESSSEVGTRIVLRAPLRSEVRSLRG